MIDSGAIIFQREVGLFSIISAKLRRLGRKSKAEKITHAVFSLISLLIAFGIYRGSLWFLKLAYHVEVIGPLLTQRMLDMLLLVFFSVLLLSNIVTSLSSFFLAKDLDLLVAAPIPPRSFFAARFLEQILHSSWMVLAFGLPALIAFAKVAGTTWTYPTMLVVLIALMIIPSAISVCLTLFLVNSLPAARVRDIVVAMLFVAFIVLYLLLRLIEPERFLNPEGFSSMVNFLASFSAPGGSYLPPRWATLAIALSFKDAALTRQAPLYFSLLITTAGMSWVIASFVFRRVYYQAYSRSQQGRNIARFSRWIAKLKGRSISEEGHIRSSKRIGAETDLIRGLFFFRKGVIREFMVKDFKLLLRDASQWSQFVLLLALIFVYLYNFRHFRNLTQSGLVGPLAIFIIGLALSAFVTTAVGVRFSFPLISLEGRLLWLIKTAPIDIDQLIKAKFYSTLPALILVSEIMAIASSWILGQSLAMMSIAVLVALFSAIIVTAISIGIGAMLPDFSAESAAKVAASFGGLVCMSSAMIATFIIVGWGTYPAYLIHHGRYQSIWPFVLCALGALMTTLIGVFLSLYLGSRAIDRLEP